VGSVDDLQHLLNLGSDQEAEDRFTLIVASLIAAMRPKGPYPVVAINGEQGCGKSMAVKVLRMLIDPNETLVRAAPREERDLIAAAVAGWVIALGNLSFIPEWLSDMLCRLSTGEGYAARPLFTDVTAVDEVTFRGQRVIMLEGIPTLLGRPDLADRAVMITLEPIASNKRTTEEELWTEFERVAPGILGALYDAVAHGLRELPNTKLESLPRMADFAVWATACEGGLGWKGGRFMAAYEKVKKVQAGDGGRGRCGRAGTPGVPGGRHQGEGRQLVWHGGRSVQGAGPEIRGIAQGLAGDAKGVQRPSAAAGTCAADHWR
jgi:hypothetical protein